MAEIVMPQLGETVTEGTITKWFKQIGDAVAQDEVLSAVTGQTLEAYIYLEIGTLNAAAPRNAASAVWGKVDRGLQCGIRMLSTRKSYEVGDTLEAEVLWRNVGDKTTHWVHPMQLDLWPILRNASGRELLVNTGARFRLIPGTTDYAPGEVRSLGTLKITLVPEGTPSPKSNREPGGFVA